MNTFHKDPAQCDPSVATARRVLVVDDDEALNTLAQKVLRRSGFETQGVLTGAEGIAQVIADPNVTLLLDHRLPDMDGTELIRTLIDKGHRVPFVAMTGRGNEQIAVEMMKLGAREYLVKGCNITDVLPEVFHRVYREVETERRLALAERHLRESEERFKLAMEANRDGLWDCNVVTGEVYYSPNYAAMLGYTPSDIHPNLDSWVELIHPDDKHAALKAYMNCLENRCETFEIEFRMRTQNGQWRWILRQGKAATRDSSGRSTRMIGTHTDITGHKHTNDELLAAKLAAEAANRAKSEFLANMSHEIRTPLNGVLGMLQLLESTSPTDEQKEYLLAAINSSKRLTRLLSDILDLSRIEAGKMQLLESEFEVNSLKESIIELFRLPVKAKGLDLKFNIDAMMPPRVIGDEARLRQILFNLVGNAIKFTETGTVEIDAAVLRYSVAPYFRVLFTVSDTGIGIDDEQLKSIFDPFVQAEGAYSRRFQGAGLGLSIVRKLVKLMGGELAIDNTPGVGTTVFLSLPFKFPEEHHLGHITHDVLAARPLTEAPLRILFAEDDDVSLQVGKRMLEKTGYSVITAKDGQEALKLHAEQDFDLILMDIQMPVMDGVVATRAIREATTLGTKSRIPIIAMTAYAMAGDKEKFLAAGMNDYIAKPVEKAALMEVIKSVMSQNAGPIHE